MCDWVNKKSRALRLKGRWHSGPYSFFMTFEQVELLIVPGRLGYHSDLGPFLLFNPENHPIQLKKYLV